MRRDYRIPPPLQQALDEAGAVLHRQTTHLIFRLPSGQQLVVSKTPADRRACAANLSILRRLRALPERPHA